MEEIQPLAGTASLASGATEVLVLGASPAARTSVQRDTHKDGRSTRRRDVPPDHRHIITDDLWSPRSKNRESEKCRIWNWLTVVLTQSSSVRSPSSPPFIQPLDWMRTRGTVALYIFNLAKSAECI
jgi:hypothetical protein